MYIKMFEDIIHEKMYIPRDIEKLSDIFFDNGYDLFIVGGAVRDLIMGNPPHDYDLVTNAQPRQIEKMLEDKYRLGLQGRHFAVIRVYTRQTPDGIEIASYRKDISKGRDTKNTGDKKVEFGHHITIRDDVMRRDLTINALYYDIKKEKIVDLVGGLDDIKNNIIRAVGNPRDRFREDRLRILRVIRFASTTGYNIDKDTSMAIKLDNRLNGISEADDVSQERINEELFKMLYWSRKNKSIQNWIRYMNLLKKFKLLDRMYPGVNVNSGVLYTLNTPIIFTKMFIKNQPTTEFHEKLVSDFKLTNMLSSMIINLLTVDEYFNKNRISDILDPLNRRLNVYRLKQEFIVDDKTIIEFSKLFNIYNIYVRAFIEYTITTDARELMNKGISGKNLGDEIRRIEIENFKSLIT